MVVKLDKLKDKKDVLHVCNNLRAADAQEIFSQCNHDSISLLADEIFRNWGDSWVAYTPSGNPAALFGALRMWPGVWSAWLIGTDEFPKVGLSITKFIHREMIPMLKAAGCHRCEARSMAGYTWSHEWLESLGAIEEATLKGYGKGKEDFLIYRLDL